MTEQHWRSGRLPSAMIEYLHYRVGQKPSTRKLRLFACACCRRHWGFVADTPAAQAIEAAEAYADGLTGEAELKEAGEAAGRTSHELYAVHLEGREGPHYVA